jgi:hypothetical protein
MNNNLNTKAGITARAKGHLDRRGRRASLLCGLAIVAGLAAGCGGAATVQPSSSAKTSAKPATTVDRTVTVPTTTTLAQCGAARDPFDPANSPPPSPPGC